MGFTAYCKYGYFLNLLYSATNGKNDRFSVGRKGSVRLSLSFKEALDENICVVFFYHLPKIISFNKSHVFVKTDFSE